MPGSRLVSMRQKVTWEKTHVKHGEGIVGLVKGVLVFGRDVFRMKTESILGRVEQRERKAEVDYLRLY